MIRKRLASIDDAVIHRLICDEIAPYSKKNSDTSSFTLPAMRIRLQRNTTFVAAKGNRRPFGFISVYRNNRVMFVDMLAVKPNFQGRGLGKQLLYAAEQFAKRSGCKAIKLFVDDSNLKAYGFYQAMGYTTAKYVTEIACYLMDKTLPPM
jgi:ribosomal protein S18 acetylase RimI-like enzyme